MTNKKYLLIPVSIILVATMLMIPMANAAYATSVVNYSNVTSPNNILGAPSTAYATMQPSNSMITVNMGTTLSAGSRPQIYAYTNISPTTVEVYSSASSTGPWTYIGYISVSLAPAGWCSCSGTLPAGQQYIALYNSGPGYVYIGAIQA